MILQRCMSANVIKLTYDIVLNIDFPCDRTNFLLHENTVVHLGVII